MFEHNARNYCVPSMLSDVYEASCGSLPDVHQVSSEIFRNNLNASAIDHIIDQDLLNFSDDFSSTTENYTARTKQISKEIIKKPKSFSRSNNVVRNLLNKGSEFKNAYQDNTINQLENAFEVIDKREIVENYWDSSTVSGKARKCSSTYCRSYNNSVKIKVTINSENVKNIKRKPYSSPENYTLQIQLSGNNNSSGKKLTDNKQIQVNSALYNGHQSRKAIEMIDCKETNTVSSYTTKNNDRIKCRKRVEAMKSNKMSSWLWTQYKKLENNPLGKKKNSDKHARRKVIPIKNISKHSKSFQSIPDEKLDKLADTKQCSIDKNKQFSSKHSEKSMKDKFVQTFTQNITDNTNLFDDPDLAKLAMWLEILNNSEYNIYNQDFCVNTPSGRLKPTASRIRENERNFELFLKEIGHFRDSDEEEIVEKVSNHEKEQTDGEQTDSDCLNLGKSSRISPVRHSSRKTKIDSNHVSLESIDLAEKNGTNHLQEEKTNKFIFDGNQWKNYFSITADSSFRKFFQNLFARLFSYTNTEEKKIQSKEEKSNFFSYFSLTQENPTTAANVWNKINPLKFANTKVKQKLFSKILDERKKSFNNVWDSKTNHIHYSFPSDKDEKYYQTKYDQKINFLNNYYNEEFDSFTNACPLNCIAPNYPYDTIPFMQCPGGCDVCNPDLNKVPNIDVSYY